MADTAGRSQHTEDDKRRQESFAAFAATGILIVVVVVIVLWLWHPWSGGTPGGGRSGGGGLVVGQVAGKEARSDVVAVVVKQGSTIADVLARNGLSADGAADLGNGSYMVSTGGRAPATVIAALKRDPGVIDAGYVFEDTSTAGTATPTAPAAGTPASMPAPAMPGTGVSPIP